MKDTLFVRFLGGFATCASLLLIGCQSDDSSSNGGGDTDSNDTDNSAGNNADCEMGEMFSPIVLGDDDGDGSGNDLIRFIEYDEETGDIFFTSMDSFFRIPAGSDSFEEIPTDGLFTNSGQFWLRDDNVYFPPGFGSTLLTDALTILHVMPITGGTLTPHLKLSPNADFAYPNLAVRWVKIVGDNVFWSGRLDTEETDDNGATISRELVFVTPFSETEVTATNTVELYSTDLDYSIEGMYPVGGSLFLSVAENELVYEDANRFCSQVDPAGGGVIDSDVKASRGGCIVGGDETSMILSRNNMLAALEGGEPIEIYMARVSADFSQSTVIMENTIMLPDMDSRNELWAWSDYFAEDVSAEIDYVTIQNPGEAPTIIGCVDVSNGADVHAVSIGPDAVYLSYNNADDRNTILRYPLP